MALSGTKLGKELEAARMANMAATSAAVEAHIERRKILNALRGVVRCLDQHLLDEALEKSVDVEELCPCSARELKVAQDLLTQIDRK